MKLGLRRKRPAPQGRQRRQPEQTASAPQAYRGGRDSANQLSRQATKAGRYWLQRFGLAILLLAALASAINILTLSTSAKVLPLNSDQAGLLRETAVYEVAASRMLAKSVWNRNKITVDTAEVSRGMLAMFPELADVSVTVPLLAHRPVVYVEPARTAIILVNNSGAFVIAASGKVLLRGATPAELNQPSLPVVTDQSGLSLKLNEQALAADEVDFIRTVSAQLAAKGFMAETMTLPSAASQLEVKPAGQPYIIKFNLRSDTARRQAGTFLATIEQLKKQNIRPAEYVDVRVTGRAYYK